MSYDLAVWVGATPRDNVEAAAHYVTIVDQLEAWDGAPVVVSDRIRAYVDELLAKWPDITEDAGLDSPWADGPMINNASEEWMYFSMVWSRAEEASEFAAQVAARHGLVCFDPQTETLRPAAPNDAARTASRATKRTGIGRWFGR